MKKLFVILLAMSTLSLGMAGAAPKVDACHYDADADAYHLINISENAFQKHLDHGDAAPGEAVSGTPFYEFDADCGIVLVPEQVAYGTMTATNYQDLTVTLDVWEGPAGVYSGTGSYTYGTNTFALAITDACVNETNKTVTARGTAVANFGTNTAAFLSLKDGETSIGARAGLLPSAASLDPYFATQCGGSPLFPAVGTGTLTFP